MMGVLMALGWLLLTLLKIAGVLLLILLVLLALVLPAALLVATLAPTLWILAYPGGAYLLQHVASMGFNVGAVSFNAIQVVSIFIAFYLTRSLITVGRTFLDGIRRQGVQLDSTLVGPFQTAYT